MYDTFSKDYDRFVNWAGRLAVEMPFIEQQMHAISKPTDRPFLVLDAACGTGMHVIELARRGYPAVGADLSQGMIQRAEANAGIAGVSAHFSVAGFGELAGKLGQGRFDAVLCLGNSLPHLLSAQKLAQAVDDFAACLRPGGLLLIQNRNFDAVMASHQRWMEPQAYRDGPDEFLFLRFYDFEPDGLINFNILALKRSNPGPWEQTVYGTRLRPQMQAELVVALADAGFKSISSYGSLDGSPFDAEQSPNLVMAAWSDSPRPGVTAG